MNLLLTGVSGLLGARNFLSTKLNEQQWSFSALYLLLILFESTRTDHYRNSNDTVGVKRKIDQAQDYFYERFFSLTSRNYYLVSFLGIITSSYLVFQPLIFSWKWIFKLLIGTISFGLINLGVLWGILKIIHRWSTIKIKEKENEKLGSYEVLGSIARATWLGVSVILMLSLFSLFFKSAIGPSIFNQIFAENGEKSLGLLYTLNLGTIGVLISSYIYPTAFMAKSSDIIGDESDNPKFKEIDKLCDVTADGTFSKLITWFIIESLTLSENFNLGLFSLIGLISWGLSYWWDTLRDQSIKEVNIEENNFQIIKIFGLITLLTLDIKSLFLNVMVLMVTSPYWISRFSKLLKEDRGFLGIFPTMSAMLAVGSTYMIGGFNSLPNIGIEFLPLLLMLEQTGFLFDLIGDRFSNLDILDVLGNQYKAIFKFWGLRMLVGEGYFGELNIGGTFDCGTLLFIAFTAFNFWRNLSQVKSSDSYQEEILGSILNWGLVAGSLVNSLSLPILDTIILSGAISDNLKKSFQLKLVDSSEKTKERSIYFDLIGDFTKDFLYPACICKLLNSIATGFIEEILMALRMITHLK